MSLEYFGYEYFCGANVQVWVGKGTDKFPLLEAAGISYSLSESRMPIYGYSSRHFDMTARGQVIVQGSIVVNFVDHEYFSRAIALGARNDRLELTDKDIAEINAEKRALENQFNRGELANTLINDYQNNIALVNQLKNKYWRQNQELTQAPDAPMNAIDNYWPIDIKITFGETVPSNSFSGMTGLVLEDVYFTSRSLPINISENVIVEEHGFFARNVSPIRDQYEILSTSGTRQTQESFDTNPDDQQVEVRSPGEQSAS